MNFSIEEIEEQIDNAFDLAPDLFVYQGMTWVDVRLQSGNLPTYFKEREMDPIPLYMDDQDQPTQVAIIHHCKKMADLRNELTIKLEVINKDFMALRMTEGYIQHRPEKYRLIFSLIEAENGFEIGTITIHSARHGDHIVWANVMNNSIVEISKKVEKYLEPRNH